VKGKSPVAEYITKANKETPQPFFSQWLLLKLVKLVKVASLLEVCERGPQVLNQLLQQQKGSS